MTPPKIDPPRPPPPWRNPAWLVLIGVIVLLVIAAYGVSQIYSERQVQHLRDSDAATVEVIETYKIGSGSKADGKARIKLADGSTEVVDFPLDPKLRSPHMTKGWRLWTGSWIVEEYRNSLTFGPGVAFGGALTAVGIGASLFVVLRRLRRRWLYTRGRIAEARITAITQLDMGELDIAYTFQLDGVDHAASEKMMSQALNHCGIKAVVGAQAWVVVAKRNAKRSALYAIVQDSNL